MLSFVFFYLASYLIRQAFMANIYWENRVHTQLEEEKKHLHLIQRPKNTQFGAIADIYTAKIEMKFW